jgi:hypothetical protein
MSVGVKVHKRMRKTRRRRGRNAEIYVIKVTPITEKPAKLYTRKELTAKHRNNFRMLLYDDFSEILEPVDSSHVSRHWDHSKETISPMKRQRLKRLSFAERDELNRQLKDAMEGGLTCLDQNKFGSPILFVRKSYGSLHMWIDYRGLTNVTRKDAYPLRVRTTLLMS